MSVQQARRNTPAFMGCGRSGAASRRARAGRGNACARAAGCASVVRDHRLDQRLGGRVREQVALEQVDLELAQDAVLGFGLHAL